MVFFSFFLRELSSISRYKVSVDQKGAYLHCQVDTRNVAGDIIRETTLQSLRQKNARKRLLPIEVCTGKLLTGKNESEAFVSNITYQGL